MPLEPPRTKRRPQRRDQILAAALTLFHERGYHGTGMDDIGAAAGITGPGIYRHFRNKEDLLETLVRELGERVLEEIERISASDLEPLAAVDALARSYVASIVHDPSLAVVSMFERGILGPDMQRWLDAMERRNLQAWTAAVRRARPELAEAEARVIVNAALTLGVAVCNYRSGLDEERLAAIVHPMVVTAILGRAVPVSPARARRGA